MPFDPVWIAAAAGALAAFVATLGVLRRNRTRGFVSPPLPPTLEPPRTRADTVSPGEREAAWSATAAADRLATARSHIREIERRLAAAERAAAGAENELDDLRSTIAGSDREVSTLRSALDAAETRVAGLETEIAVMARAPSPDAAAVDRVRELESQLGRLRDEIAAHAAAERELRHRLESTESPSEEAVDERHQELADARRRLAELESQVEAAASATSETRALQQRVQDLTARIETLRADVERLTNERDAARSEASRAGDSLRAGRAEADRRIAAAAAEVARATARAAELERAAGEPGRDAARLKVRNAEIADLEARLAALAAARESELRRLNDKIGSMEHLYVEVEARQRRIEQLEDEVKSLAESRDEAVAELDRVERELVTLQGTHAEAVAGLDRLAELERELTGARTRIAELELEDESGALRAEIVRLQRTLDGERDRNARLQRRLSLESTDSGRQPSYAEWDRRLRERIDGAVAGAVAPLEARIERLRQVVEEKERRIATLAGPGRSDGPDDLTRIRGIGPKIQEILHRLGITTFQEIAEFSDQDVDRVGAALPIYGRRILDDGWIEQARELSG